MRDYAKKRKQYELDRSRYLYLCDWCYSAKSAKRMEIIGRALDETVMDGLQPYLRRYVLDRRVTVQRLQTEGLPCSEDYFRLIRKRFYFELDRIMRHGKGANRNGKNQI